MIIHIQYTGENIRDIDGRGGDLEPLQVSEDECSIVIDLVLGDVVMHDRRIADVLHDIINALEYQHYADVRICIEERDTFTIHQRKGH